VSLRELEEVVKRLQPEDNCLRKTVRSSDLKIVLSLIGKCATEQKEHTHGLGVCWCGYCGDHTSLAGTGKCYQCGKPIPAEKKGCEHEWEKGITNHPDWCRKCGEPEPKDPYVSMFALYGYTKREDALSILRTNRAKEVCGDCETGDNSAQMITLDGKIWQNEKDCRKELLRRDEMFDFDKKAVAHVKVTLEVLSK
jgi:hypothetical protein